MREIAGIGLGMRAPFAKELIATSRAVDFLEIIPENWTSTRHRNMLAEASERWPVVPHSIHLSIGGPDPIGDDYLAVMRDISRLIDAPFFSDHLSYSSVGGIQTQELLPLPFSEEAVDHTVKRIIELKPRLDVPLVLENPSYYSVMPGSSMTEIDFMLAVFERGDCGMLLDVNNVFVNATNHGYDPIPLLDRIPLERVRQIHLAGHRYNEALDTIVDTHNMPIRDEVWALYEHVIRRAGRVIPTLIEWDSEWPPLDELLDQVDLARQHAAAALDTNLPGAARAPA